MKATVIGSKDISFETLEKYLPDCVTELIWCGNCFLLPEYAKKKNIKLVRHEWKSNMEILGYVDMIIVFSDEDDVLMKWIVAEGKRINKNLKTVIVGLNKAN